MRNEGNAIEGLLFDKEYEGRNRPSLALDVIYLSQQELPQLFWFHEEHYQEGQARVEDKRNLGP